MEEEDLLKKIEQLKIDNEKLLADLSRLKKKPEGKIGYILLTIGFILMALAAYFSHNVSAFIGIALTFWGALLLYIRPTRFVRKEILDTTITEPLNSLYTFVKELGYKGTPQYISPNTLWGLRNTTLYIPKSDNTPKPTDDQLSTDEILIHNSQAIKITPPGQGLSRLIEEELKTNFSTVNLDYLKSNLETAIVEGLEIVETFQMECIRSTVHVETRGSIFFEAFQNHMEKEKQGLLNDPLNSAIACILARSSRKPIIIEKIQLDIEEKILKTDFRLLDQPD